MDKAAPLQGQLLVVDDDIALGKTLLAILAKAGRQAEWAMTGEAAIKLIEANPDSYRVILIDLHLPDMNGVDVLRAVKKISPDLGAIMITGHADVDTALASLHEGAFAYIQKPYNVDDVKLIINRLFERQRLSAENRELLKKMMQLNAELEGRVAARTKELHDANVKLLATVEQLQKSDTVKTQFLAMVSHELRTPLTVILGAAKVLLDQMGKIERETVQRYLEMIISGTHRLSGLVEGVLDLSKVHKQGVTLHYEPLDLKAVATEAIERQKAAHPDKVFELELPPEARELTGDKDRTHQIFSNLLSNASKYSPAGGVIRVKAHVEGEGVVLSVIDSGKGIPPEQHDQIFQPFYRTNDETNFRMPGTGLGLTITKAIVETMGGTISVKNNEPGGCIFTVYLPKHPPVTS